MERKRRWSVALLLSVAVFLIAFCVAVLVGSRPLSLHRAWQGLSPDREVLVDLRIPRALLALWTGGALALAGVLFQALLRNALATPYTLGVSGGASLGAVIAIIFGWRAAGDLPAVSIAAFVGAAAVLGLLLLIASDRGRLDSTGLLLAGITINSLCLALILFLSNLATFMQSFSLTRWMMGGLDAPAYSTLIWLTATLAPVCGVVFWYGREWNLLSIGDSWAATRGISTSRLTLTGCLAGSVLTGAVTALSGPIGFVGLIVPHALRLWLGADHRILAPCSFLLGAAFVALCDTGSRTILAPVEIPVGVVTALLGGPVFIWMLRSRGRSVTL
jgi:iron complex transport system permease protein